MNVRRASWVWALILSVAAHGAVVAAFTPDTADIAEAGSGAGSSVEGSIDAILGTDVQIEDIVSEELQPALDTELVEVSEPVTMAALAPAETMPTPPEPAVALAPAAPAAVEVSAAAEITPVETASAIAPSLTADIAATPIESDLAAAPATEPTEIVPTEALTAAPPQEAKPVEPLPAQQAIELAAEIPRPQAKPTELKAVEAETTPQEVKPAETRVAEARPVEVKAVEAKPDQPTETKPVETRRAEKAEPTPKPPREKAQKADRTRKAQAPKRGSGEADSRQGSANTDKTTTARDNGTGRSREAGAGAAANSNYKGKVQAAIRRNTRTPSKAARLGISGKAMVSFTVQPSGAAKNIVLASSSGNALLDNAALTAVRQASPFPRMPDGMPQLSLTAPIIFESKLR